MYLHPNGQIPAYEWNFGDVNPPVHAWAIYYLYQLEKEQRGVADTQFLKRSFNKLLINFAWWLNRKDPSGRNIFEGGFLGLDNVGVFDRSKPLPTGGHLEQADGTAWMALYSLAMLNIAMELSSDDPGYEGMVGKFAEHFLWIAGSMDRQGEHDDELWDEDDGFFYDVLRLPDGRAMRLKVRSMVGLIPLCAVAIMSQEFMEEFPRVAGRLRNFFRRNPEISANLHPPSIPGVAGRHLFCILDEHRLRRVLHRMLDEKRFLSPYGIRSLSKWHEENPYMFLVNEEPYQVAYEPAESRVGFSGAIRTGGARCGFR